MRKTTAARDLEVVDVLSGGDGVGSKWLMGRQQVIDLWVSAAGLWVWFCDQRRAWMVVTGLGGVTSFFVGLGMKNLCGATGYIRIVGAGLGLFKISWGKNLKGNVIFGWISLLMVLLSSGCRR
nr:hypothetical protein CFP56_24886 [Quercus suber]